MGTTNTARTGRVEPTMQTMKTAQIEEQIASYWEGLRDGRPLPYRSEVDPRGLEGVLEYMFIAERISRGQVRLRVAGMHLNRLMGMETRGMDIVSLFAPDVRVEVTRAFCQLFDTPARLAFDLAGRSGRIAGFPLRGPGGEIDRAMGCVVSRPGSDPAMRAPGARLDVAHVEIDPIRSVSEFPGPRAISGAAGMNEDPAPFFARPQRRAVLRVVRNEDSA